MFHFLPYSANTNMFVVMVSTLKLLKYSASYENRACPFDHTMKVIFNRVLRIALNCLMFTKKSTYELFPEFLKTTILSKVALIMKQII